MNPIVLAGAYSLFGDIVATFVAATVAAIFRRQVNKAAVGTFLSFSGGFIIAVAFLDLLSEAQQRSHNTILVLCLGVAVGLRLMIGLEILLDVFGLGEEEEEKPNKQTSQAKGARNALLIAIGMAMHHMPEALPIGAAIVISPSLSLLVALVMMVETFAESGAIVGELMGKNTSVAKMYALTMWPSLFSLIGRYLAIRILNSSSRLIKPRVMEEFYLVHVLLPICFALGRPSPLTG